MFHFRCPKFSKKIGQRRKKFYLSATFAIILFVLCVYIIEQFILYQNATERLLKIFGDHDPVTLITLPSQKTTLLQPLNHCKLNNDTEEEPFYLYMVISAPQNYDLRNFVRTKYTDLFQNVTTSLRSSIKILFFIGLAQNNSIMKSVFNEAQAYGDIIIEDFQESYLNLTLKSMRMLKWYHINCHKSRYLIKADDDMFVNPELFFRRLHRLTRKQKPFDDLIAGYPLNGNPALRDPESKWFIPYSMWSESIFPEYASLGLYVLSRLTAFKIYNISIKRKITLFPFEDVYLNGIIGNRMMGVKSQRISGFVTWKDFSKLYSCDIGRISLTFISSDTSQKKLRFLNCLYFLIQFPNTCSPSLQIEDFCNIFI